jgi:hypothetical protein
VTVSQRSINQGFVDDALGFFESVFRANRQPLSATVHAAALRVDFPFGPNTATKASDGFPLGGMFLAHALRFALAISFSG